MEQDVVHIIVGKTWETRIILEQRLAKSSCESGINKVKMDGASSGNVKEINKGTLRNKEMRNKGRKTRGN
jgi:hypothetical protein